MIKRLLVPALIALAAPLALAKLPALDDAAKAKAAEAAAKTAWQAKVDAYQLCQSQDRVVAHYRKSAGASAKDAKAVAVKGVKPAVAGSAPAAPSAAPANPCADPGPFAYTPAEQKPLEAAGAHSPAGTATSAPSNKATAATMQGPSAGTATPTKKP